MVQSGWNELARHLKEQEEAILDVKRELKHQIASEVQARLTKLTQSEKLISHLVEVLHSEMDDACKALQVETEQHEDGVTLSIENEDRIISIDSKTIIEELKRGLESIWWRSYVNHHYCLIPVVSWLRFYYRQSF